MFSLLSVVLNGASGSPDERAARTPIANVRTGRRRWAVTSEKPNSELVVF